jgi:colicin import membrane protein
MSQEPKQAEAHFPADTQAIWANAIRHKIRSNLAIPAGTPLGAKAVFTIVQQPTGKVVSASLQSSSGYPAYDRAARRAILKSSPLPRPEDPKDFVKSISLTFTP